MRNKEYGITQNWNYVILSVVIVAVFTLIMLYYCPQMREIDANILHSIRLALSPYPSYIPTFIADFGRSYNMLWPQIAAGSVLVSHKKYVKAFLLVFFTQASFALTDVIKNFVCRERPCGDAYPGFSFPSGHTSTTVCFYGIIIYLIMHYMPRGFWRYFLVALFGIFIFMCALSRLWLGVHYLSDVITGMFLGFLLVNLYVILSKYLNA